ncbi:ewing's tumor-associated antigen 1-like [Hippoglossus hippoglossus]|uniref:ewing's tumor-associated antigen 1-like n=1 Tax=Hippoglossus hippoglossus TaxID=8267 RepID=UPI00148C2827|nr:ewing's tumor-associated antigen 1-like [Hippoglossus hippoglossus]
MRQSAASGSVDFTDLWRSVSSLCPREAPERSPAPQMPGADTPAAVSRDLQSPIRRGGSRFAGLNNGDSPGDGEASQDIFWDSTSPDQAHTGSGCRNTRVVEISDIVNRIAPKDVKLKPTDSTLLQWIGDSAVPSTPEIRVPRIRKRSSRQSSVDDLMKLARQFDQNMQQDKETTERLNTFNWDLNECVTTSKVKTQGTSSYGSVKDPKDQVEAELQALFDCSTQNISGRLSQGSVASACSQEVKDRPGTSASAEPRQSQKPKSGSAAQPAGEKGTCGLSANNFDDFDDDWDNDDLLNDSFVLAMNQNPDQHQNAQPNATLQSNTKMNTTHFTSVYKASPKRNSVHQPSYMPSKPSGRILQELCPKVKTTNRSTFKLESNPLFQPESATKQVSSSRFTATQPKSQISDQKPVATETLITPQPDKIAGNQRGALAADSSKDISDSLWGDGDDDALLYQVCDSVERISNSQQQQVSAGSCQEKPDFTVDKQRKTTAPLPIDTTWSTNVGASASRQSPSAFVRSNSLPGTSCETVNYQGWNIPMKCANNKSGMSQSLPGSRVSLGTFSRCRDPSGAIQAGSANVHMKPSTVTARTPQNSKSCHTAFKRNVSDSAAICSKVFVTSQMTGKCSAAEIERKKQEALAKRRQRMQNAPKP